MSQTTLPPDTVFEILSDNHRRHILCYLHSLSDKVADFDELVEVIVSEDIDTEAVEKTDPDTHQHIAIALHHNHLPKLTDVGLIDYDEKSGAVQYSGDPLVEKQLLVSDEEQR